MDSDCREWGCSLAMDSARNQGEAQFKDGSERYNPSYCREVPIMTSGPAPSTGRRVCVQIPVGAVVTPGNHQAQASDPPTSGLVAPSFRLGALLARDANLGTRPVCNIRSCYTVSRRSRVY
jgi:hypothetical protein